MFRSPTLYQFRFQLLDAVLRAENDRPLTIHGVSQAMIESTMLKFVTEPNSSPEDELVYTLHDTPSYGALWIGNEQLANGSR